MTGGLWLWCWGEGGSLYLRGYCVTFGRAWGHLNGGRVGAYLTVCVGGGGGGGGRGGWKCGEGREVWGGN